MATETIVVVLCLIAGFLLGRIGSSKKHFDGMLILEDKPEDCQLMLSLSEEELLRSSTLLLRVVSEKQ